MGIYTLSQWVMFFYIYCFLGWVWESAYVSVCQKKLVNRGFLKGPFLPIYGSGAICILIVTIPVRGNILVMAVAGMAAATLLEYVTGAVMEWLFRVRYWDYSDKFLNINGYICLMSTLCWGVMTVLVVDVIHVRIEELVFLVEEKYITALVLLITPFITADFVTSFHAAIHLRDILVQNEKMKEELQKLSKKKEELENALREISEKTGEFGSRLSGTGEKAKELGSRLAGTGEKAKELGSRLAGTGEKAKELGSTLAESGGKAKEQIAQELQELLVKIGEQKGKMRIMYGKSVKALLKRNPTAVSRLHKDTFAELKQTLMDKIEEIKNE